MKWAEEQLEATARIQQHFRTVVAFIVLISFLGVGGGQEREKKEREQEQSYSERLWLLNSLMFLKYFVIKIRSISKKKDSSLLYVVLLIIFLLVLILFWDFLL